MDYYIPDFKSGDIISLGTDEFVVLENFGHVGRVQSNEAKGYTARICWETRGERCKLEPNSFDKRLEENRE